VLTRRDQLKLKESKQAEKQAKKDKSKAKEAETDEGGDQEPEHVQKKPRRQRKPKVDANQPEENKEPQESKPPSKRVSRGKAAPKPAAEPEMAVADVPEAMPDEAVPGKRQARSKSKAEPKDPKPKKAPKNADGKLAKAKAKSSAAKSKPGRKAKALADANINAEQNMDEEDEGVAGETDTPTPKKKLFESDEENGDEGGHDSPHERLDSKTGKVKPLGMIFEQDKPSEWIATRPRRKKAEKTVQTSAASAAAASSNEAGGKAAKAKGKGTKRSKQELSPFAKKENKRRKQAELATMQESPQEDLQVQGVFLQYMKQCKDLTYDGLKEYLYKNLPHQFNHGKLNPYFSRPACGVQVDLKTGKPGKLTEIVYFGRCGTANSFNASVVTAYVSGHLMAFWLNDLYSSNKLQYFVDEI